MIVKYEKSVNGVFRGETRIKRIYKGIFGVFGVNPFTWETYRILKENFPTKIGEIIEYANMHPQIVPFINEDPMLVCSLGIEGMPIRWLISDGASWIDTGIKNIDKDYTAKFKYKVSFNVGTRIDNTWQTNRSYRIGNTTPTSARADWPIGNTTQNLSWSEASLYDMEVSKGLLKVNEAIIYSGSVSSAACPDYTYYVFAMNNIGSMSGCYEGQHFANHELIYKETSVQNLVPFVSPTRDGMVDLVNMEFHPNEGTGHFTDAYTLQDGATPWYPI